MKKDDTCFRCNGSGMLSSNGWCAGWCGDCNGTGKFSWEEIFARHEKAAKEADDIVGEVPPQGVIDQLAAMKGKLPKTFKKKGKKNG